jgi:hypothetical protein
VAGKQGKVRSQAQWRWMFATRQRFAHRWARSRKRQVGKTTDYRILPPRRGAGRRRF